MLASNRLWRTIPRLPERYPMSTRYYQALFDGELGFEQVYTWATPPRLGPLVIDDQAPTRVSPSTTIPGPLSSRRCAS